jgi:hypothetical protein
MQQIRHIQTTCLLIVILAQSFTHAFAQKLDKYKLLQCIVLDSVSKQPIFLATASVLDSAGNPHTVAVTDTLGMVLLRSAQLKTYIINIHASGYGHQSISIADIPGRDTIVVGTIVLGQQANVLNDVVVKGKLPLLKQEIDRIVYRMQADPDSKFKSTLEMMRKMPYLSMDAEENILLKGNRNYRIFINGKPSGMMDNNPKEVLRTIPASTIQQIEIITAPSAKYDAEGLAGIINIVTIKKIADGYNGTVNLYHREPMVESGIGTSLTIKKKRWGISGYSGVNFQRQPLIDYANDQQSGLFSLQQKGQKKTKGHSAYIGLNMSAEIDSFNLLTAQVNANFLNNNGQDVQTSVLNDVLLNQQYKTDNTSELHNYGADAAFDWQIGSRNHKSRLVTISYRYQMFSNQHDNAVRLFDKLNFTDPDFLQYNNGRNQEHTVQLDFVQAFKKVYVEAGAKSIFRNNNSDFHTKRYNATSNQFDWDSLASNQFLSTQNIIAIYNNYRFSKESWSFQAGFRVEHTSIHANFIANATLVDQLYLNFIPSLMVNRGFKDGSSLNFVFSQRIKRPGINRLNPFVDKTNPNFISTGNPALQPVINNDLMVGYGFSKKVSFNIGLAYSFSNNIDLRVSTFDPLAKLTTTTFRNTGSASRLGVDYNVQYPINAQMNMGINGNFAQFWISGEADSRPVKNNLFTYYAAVNANYRLKEKWQFNGDLTINSENPSGLQSKSNAFVSTSLSVSRNAFNNKLNFSAYINNPFTKFRDNISSSFGYNFTQTSLVRDYFRAYGLSVNYKFGRLNKDLKTGKRKIRNDDVSN